MSTEKSDETLKTEFYKKNTKFTNCTLVSLFSFKQNYAIQTKRVVMTYIIARTNGPWNDLNMFSGEPKILFRGVCDFKGKNFFFFLWRHDNVETVYQCVCVDCFQLYLFVEFNNYYVLMYVHEIKFFKFFENLDTK